MSPGAPTRRVAALGVLGSLIGGGLLARAAAPLTQPLPNGASDDQLRFLDEAARWNLPVLGRADAPLSLVLFFDYHCPFCRQLEPELPPLVAANPDLRVMFAEYPVLLPDSAIASRMALAAAAQGRYLPAHNWLFRVQGRYSARMVPDLAAAIGADPGRLAMAMGSPTIARAIRRNLDAGQWLGIDGTPAMLSALGEIEGAVPAPVLQRFVAAMRRAAAAGVTPRRPA